MSATKTLIAPAAELALAGPIGSFDAYIDRVSRIPVLSREEEQRLATRFREQYDLEAARALVLSHLRFVVHIARGYVGYGLPINDLVQEGNVGLMKAVKRYDAGVGVRLVSFAVHWIRAEIHEYVLRNWRVVKIATTKSQRKLFFNLRRMKKNLDAYEDSDLRPEDLAKIATDLGVSEQEVINMNRRMMMGGDASLNVSLRGDEDGTGQWQDWLADDRPLQDVPAARVEFLYGPDQVGAGVVVPVLTFGLLGRVGTR